MKERFKLLRIIHFAMVFGVLIFMSVSYFVGNKESQTFPTLSYIAVGICFLAVILSFILPFKLANATTNVSAIQKYFVAKIMQWAMVEFGAMFNLAVYFIFNDTTNYMFGTAMLFILFMHKPSESEMKLKFPDET